SCGSSSRDVSPTQPSSPTSNAVPAAFFGMTFERDANVPSVPFGSTRTWDGWGIAWDALEPSRGTYNWSALDARLTLAQQHGADVLFTFGRTPAWAVAGTCTGNYTPNGCAEPPANLQDWDDFVRALVAHAGGRIHYWEIWNEPNDSGSYTGDIPTLVTLARRAYTAIKSADPSAVVLTPSSTGGNDVGTSYMDQYLNAGGGAYADVIAFHGYWGSTSDLVPEHIVSLVESYRQVLTKHGLADKPLWDTEASWGDLPNVDQDTATAFLARHYLLHWSEQVQRFYWYAWDNTEWGTLWT